MMRIDTCADMCISCTRACAASNEQARAQEIMRAEMSADVQGSDIRRAHAWTSAKRNGRI